MTQIDLRAIVSKAAAAFGPAAVEKAYQAAAAVPQNDDLAQYAAQVAAAVARVLEAVLAQRWADLRRIRRETAIAEAVGRAMCQPTGPQRH